MTPFNAPLTEQKSPEGIRFDTTMPSPLHGAGCLAYLALVFAAPIVFTLYMTLSDFTLFLIVGSAVSVLAITVTYFIYQSTQRPIAVQFGVTPAGFYHRQARHQYHPAQFDRASIFRFYVLAPTGSGQAAMGNYELMLETIVHEDFSICQRDQTQQPALLQAARAMNAYYGIQTETLLEPTILLINSELSQSMARQLAKGNS